MSLGVLRAWIDYCELHSAKDKLFRAAQYGSRYLSWFLERSGARKQDVRLFQEVYKLLSNSRKLFRLGRWTESILSLSEIVTKNADPLWKGINSLFQVASGAYYFYDMCQWLHFAQIILFENKSLLDDKRNGAWLLRIVLGTCALYLKYDENSKKLHQLEEELMEDVDSTEDFYGEEIKNNYLEMRKAELLAKQRFFIIEIFYVIWLIFRWP